MSESVNRTGTLQRPSFRISLRVWLVTMAIVTCLVAWQSRHSLLTPANVSHLSEVASIDEDIKEIAWSPERDRMALVAWGKPVVIRDALSLEVIETIGEGQKLIHFAFSPDKDVVAYCRNGKSAEILDRRTGRIVTLDVGNDQPQMTFGPDGKLLATGGYGTISSLWRSLGRETLAAVRRGANGGGPEACV